MSDKKPSTQGKATVRKLSACKGKVKVKQLRGKETVEFNQRMGLPSNDLLVNGIVKCIQGDVK